MLIDMKKNDSKGRKRKKPTWTFQPDDDVVKAFRHLFADADHGKRTKIVNESLRLRLSDASISLTEQELAALQARLQHLRGKASSSD